MNLNELIKLEACNQFLERYKHHFIQFETKNDLLSADITKYPALKNKGFMYILNVSCYDVDPSVKFTVPVDKIGKTDCTIRDRLNHYKNEVEITKIECIRSSFQEEKEALLKKFLSSKTIFSPVAGQEYYKGCRILIKLCMLILNSIPGEEIVLYRSFLSNSKKQKHVELFFNKIVNYLRDISNKPTYKLVLQEIQEEDEDDEEEQNSGGDPNYKCEYCGKCFSTNSNLLKHKKTASYCIEIQKSVFNVDNEQEVFTCEHCKQVFTVKCNYQSHIIICKAKKGNEHAERIESLIRELDGLKMETAACKKELEITTILYREKLAEIDKLKQEKKEEIDKLKQEKNQEIIELKESIREKDEYIQNNLKYI